MTTRVIRHIEPSKLRRLTTVALACLALSTQGTEIRISENQLIAREKTEPAKAYQFQQSTDLVLWQNIDTPQKGDGTIIEIAVALPDAYQKEVFIRTQQTGIWAPEEIDIGFIKKLTEYNEPNEELDFLPGSKSQIVMTLNTVEDGLRIDSSIYSNISWNLDENDFNHAIFTLTIEKVVYRSPFSATYTIQQLAEVSGEDMPHRVVSDLNYTGENEGSYSTKFYMLSGTLDKQTDGSIGSLFP